MKCRKREAYEMKDSGIEWIGEIPENWNIRKLSSIASRITDFVASGSFASLKVNVQYLDEPDYAMLVRAADLSNKNKVERVYINEDAYNFLNNSNLYGGEIILPNIGSVGDVYMYEPLYNRASLAPNSIMITMNGSNKFYYYWFINPWANSALKLIGSDSVQLKFNKTQLRQFKVVEPNIDEQQKITTYLDEKSTAFDSLISKKEKMIENLEEAKKSLISELVTGKLKVVDGKLVPREPEEMKDSGIEWIGLIPDRWGLVRIKHIASLKSGETINSERIKETGLYPVYGGNGLRGYTSLFTHEGFYPLIGRQGALCGNIQYAEGRFWASEHAIVVDIKEEYSNNCIAELLRSMNLNQYSVSAAQPGLSVSIIENLKVPNAPIEEQKEIELLLKAELNRFNQLIQSLVDQIKKLKEAKQSLISEAVTGKIEILED